MKKISAVILSIILPLSCTACASDTSVTGDTIGLSVSTLNNPFFVELADGAREEAKCRGINITILDANEDTAKQANSIEDLISKKVTVLIVNPVDSDAVTPSIQAAIEKGIKVISVDRVINDVKIDCEISSDNIGGAKMAGEYLAELVGTGAKVAELEGVAGTSSAIERGEGFHLAADGVLNVVSKQTANFNRAEGLNVMENILQANSDIKGVFAHNDEMALGAIEAIKAKGLNIKVVGFDATDDAKSAVENGELAATVAQKPELMGRVAVETAVDIINGKAVEDRIAVEVELVK